MGGNHISATLVAFCTASPEQGRNLKFFFGHPPDHTNIERNFHTNLSEDSSRMWERVNTDLDILFPIFCALFGMNVSVPPALTEFRKQQHSDRATLKYDKLLSLKAKSSDTLKRKYARDLKKIARAEQTTHDMMMDRVNTMVAEKRLRLSCEPSSIVEEPKIDPVSIPTELHSRAAYSPSKPTSDDELELFVPDMSTEQLMSSNSF